VTTSRNGEYCFHIH